MRKLIIIAALIMAAALTLVLPACEPTYEELQAIQQETEQLLDKVDFPADTVINTEKNRVEVRVTDILAFGIALEEAGVELPDNVSVVQFFKPPDGLNPDPSVHFPQLLISSNSYMEALLVSELTLEDGYLRAGGDLIVWQPGYFVHNNEGTIEIWDKDGKVVGRVGEKIYMGGGNFKPNNLMLTEGIPPDIEGPFWLQGQGTRLSLNFSSELFSLELISYGDHDYFFMKKKPPLEELTGIGTKVTVTGKLIASYDSERLPDCPYIRIDARPEENKGVGLYTPIWPSDFQARVTDGALEIIDGEGQLVVRDGEYVIFKGRRIGGIQTEISRQLLEEMPGECYNTKLIVKEVARGEE